jgi:hypothetical protein
MICISKGEIIYRGARTVEKNPIPRLCPETGKTGVYFSIGHPFIAEGMSVEYNKPLYIAKYVLTENIFVGRGKYGYRTLEPKRYILPYDISIVRPQHNISHIDFELIPEPIEINFHGKVAELFLNPYDLELIEYVDSYRVTPEQILEKYRAYKK